MNWVHLRAFLWLRWRLMANHWRRAGAFSAALMIIVAGSLVASAIPVFAATLGVGIYLIPKATPAQLMYAWDALIAAFLLFWSIGLMTELQRNDPLSLSKFMHLPVSVQGAFLINFLSSLLRLSLIFFLPMMFGYALALIYVRGFSQILVLPSLAAFLLMITGPTYQFQGWLASLMSNPRLRRTVVVGCTMAFITATQLPQLIHLYTPKLIERSKARQARQEVEVAKLQRSLQHQEFDFEEFQKRLAAVNATFEAESKVTLGREMARWEGLARVANEVVPFGWLPAGVMHSAEGRAWPSLLGLVGMTSIGAFSLWRAYQTTLGQFLGRVSGGKRRAPAVRESAGSTPASAAPAGKRRKSMLEARLPGLSEPVSAIALGGFRSLLRSPEAKMSLLTPLIMGGIFGTILTQSRQSAPELLRPLFGIGAIAFTLFGLLQIMANQFGIDRDGFRVFVLCSAPRRDILLGKNLALAPAAFLLAAVLILVVMVLCPMRIDHALAMIPQLISMYLLFCLMANLFSIVAPMYIAAGTMKPANPKFSTVAMQLFLFMILFPTSQGLTLIPLGAEVGLRAFGWSEALPICLLLSLIECAAVCLLYYFALGWLGALLQAREQRILETVTNRAL